VISIAGHAAAAVDDDNKGSAIGASFMLGCLSWLSTVRVEETAVMVIVASIINKVAIPSYIFVFQYIDTIVALL